MAPAVVARPRNSSSGSLLIHGRSGRATLTRKARSRWTVSSSRVVSTVTLGLSLLSLILGFSPRRNQVETSDKFLMQPRRAAERGLAFRVKRQARNRGCFHLHGRGFQARMNKWHARTLPRGADATPLTLFRAAERGCCRGDNPRRGRPGFASVDRASERPRWLQAVARRYRPGLAGTARSRRAERADRGVERSLIGS